MRLRLLLAVAATVALAAVAQAATPLPRAQFYVHDHDASGDNWHVEVKTNADATALTGLVVYSERCGEFTPFAKNVPIDADGDVVANGYLNESKPGAGTWGFRGTFVSPRRLDGEFRFITPKCDTGPIRFSAPTSEGRTSTYGTPIGSLPDLRLAKGRREREIVRIYRNAKKAARETFPTYRAALRHGYVRYKSANKRPQLFHLRNDAYARDKVWFDARKVESLVYYRPSVGEPILVALMFRAPGTGWPKYGRPVLGWHAHGTNTKRLQTVMTHVWLTRRMETALANCVPIDALERDVPRFAFEPGSKGFGHESSPCIDAT